MRVKISYGVNIEEIPEEILVLMDYVYNKNMAFGNQLELIEEFSEKQQIENLPEIIDKARRTLMDLDSRLSDIEAISRGYLNYLKEEGEEDVSNGRSIVDSIIDSVDDTTTQHATGDTNNSGT